jgi:putative ABC transport system ATP-binding protein
MGSAVAVAGRGLAKSYEEAGRRLRVLDGVDLEVRAGEFVSVMGPSGSGKSTLLHLLGGLDVPDEGDVVIGGQPLSALDDDGRTRLRGDRVGIVYQFFNLVPVLTAAENVALPAVIAGDRADRHSTRTEELLDLVGLAGHGDKLPSQLSGGQQQRVAVARALFRDPDVVLADEPTGNLDLDTGAEILDLFVGARDLGQSLLMVTHDPRSAACGDRVLLLRDGRLTGELVFADLDGRAAIDPGHPERVAAVLAMLARRPGEVPSVNGRRRRRTPLRAEPRPAR